MSRTLGVVNMLKIQMVSFILCLLGAFKDNFVVEVSMQNKNLHQPGTYHKNIV